VTRSIFFGCFPIALLMTAAGWLPRSIRAAETAFELRDDDRVVLIGDTLIERSARYGYVEMALAMAFPNSTVKFRNLGWSGDNVHARSRDYFDKQGDGYARRLAHIDRLKPTVVFLSYGGNESFAGQEGLPTFVAGYQKLLDDLKQTGARFVLLSPMRLEKLGPPLPDPAAQNRHRAMYASEIKKLAAERGHRFIDLFSEFKSADVPLTYNGIHLTQAGYQQLAAAVCAELDIALPEFRGKDELQQAIVAKNRLYFYRWRPQNETYLFGHRKHEQGRNAVEIPQFDPLVAVKEQEIAKLLKRP
jgi:lysophospholipase L1-like esterase